MPARAMSREWCSSVSATAIDGLDEPVSWQESEG